MFKFVLASQFDDILVHIQDRIVAKGPDYKIYLMTKKSQFFYRYSLSGGGSLPVYEDSTYLITYKYKDEWYTFYLDFKGLTTEEVVKAFRIRMIQNLRRLTGEKMIDYHGILKLEETSTGILYDDRLEEWEYV